jgi:acetylornithine deacetylase/succinyl-diaminopimelate desuccinylase-like protein
MLTYCRPKGSRAETNFRERFLLPLGLTPDRHGNLIATIGVRPRVLWSCHTDTVHYRSGRQHVDRDDRRSLFALPLASRSNCLGADDTAGVFLMSEMLKAGIEGQYVFHYGEEHGGIGSGALVADHPAWLDDIQIAIALDRKGTTDVITHQGGRTASDQFARELADGIGLGYTPSDRGIFTDTERYAGIVPECTNLSIGYEHAHTPDEWLDGAHVLALLERLCTLDTRALGVYRDPTAPDPTDPWALDVWPEDSLGTPDRDDRREDYLDPDYAALAEWFRDQKSRYTN